MTDTTTDQADAYDLRLDKELHVVRTLRMTMESLLQVLECARDDLGVLGDKMDKVRTASEHCRKELLKRHRQPTTEAGMATKQASGKRRRKQPERDECIGLQRTTDSQRRRKLEGQYHASNG